MRLKRTLIALFALLSLVALWDMTTSGPSSFGSIFDQTLGQIEQHHGRMPARTPDFEERRELDSLSGIGSLAVDGTSGRLEIARSESGEVTAEYTVRIWQRSNSAASAEESASLARQISVFWEREGDRARLKVERPGALPAGIARLLVDVRMKVPEGMILSVAHSGEAFVHGVSGTVRLDHSGGSAVLQDLEGSVSVESRFSSLAIHRVRGPVQVEQQGGVLDLRQIEGRVDGRIRLGGVDVEGVTGDVTLSVDRGASRVAGVRGDIDLAGKYGELKVFLEGEGGWRIDAVAEMGEIETDLALEHTHSGVRSELSGVLGDGAYGVKIRVEQGVASIARR